MDAARVAAMRRPAAAMSLAELLVASGMLLALTAAAGSVLARAQLTFRAQPEVADMQQRAARGGCRQSAATS